MSIAYLRLINIFDIFILENSVILIKLFQADILK